MRSHNCQRQNYTKLSKVRLTYNNFLTSAHLYSFVHGFYRFKTNFPTLYKKGQQA
jgi:hypothetical protein